MSQKRRRSRAADAGSSEVAYRSGLLYEADIVADALERAKVPFFRREESSSGLDFAMPVAPVQEPGVTWAVVVPQSALRRARRIISRLPVSKDMNPGVWGLKPRPEVKSFFKQYAALSLIAIAIGWLGSFTEFCQRR
jgi:hypothetical protein